MANKWIDALKIFNKNKGEWCIPKKGRDEYKQVKKIMNNNEKPLTKKQLKERENNIKKMDVLSQNVDIKKYKSIAHYNS